MEADNFTIQTDFQEWFSNLTRKQMIFKLWKLQISQIFFTLANEILKMVYNANEMNHFKIFISERFVIQNILRLFEVQLNEIKKS